MGGAPPDVQPMLLGSGIPRSIGGWTAEPKLDGWRGRLIVHDSSLLIRTRGGRDVAAHVPSAAPLAGAGFSLVLDGELVAGAGRSQDFYLLAGALARKGRGRVPVTFVAFDLLWHDGDLLTALPHTERRSRLAALGLGDHGVPVVPSFQFDDAPLLFSACEALGAEGIVLKDGASPYRPGARSSAWRKVKTTEWRSHMERRFSHRFG